METYLWNPQDSASQVSHLSRYIMAGTEGDLSCSGPADTAPQTGGGGSGGGSGSTPSVCRSNGVNGSGWHSVMGVSRGVSDAGLVGRTNPWPRIGPTMRATDSTLPCASAIADSSTIGGTDTSGAGYGNGWRSGAVSVTASVGASGGVTEEGLLALVGNAELKGAAGR